MGKMIARSFIELVYLTPSTHFGQYRDLPQSVIKRDYRFFGPEYFRGIRLKDRQDIDYPRIMSKQLYTVADNAFRCGLIDRVTYNLALDAAAYCHNRISTYPNIDHFKVRHLDFDFSEDKILSTIKTLGAGNYLFDPMLTECDDIYDSAFWCKDANQVRRIFYYLATSCVLVDLQSVKGVGLFALDIRRVSHRLDTILSVGDYLSPLSFFRMRSKLPNNYKYSATLNARIRNLIPYNYRNYKFTPTKKLLLRMAFDCYVPTRDYDAFDSILSICLDER